MRDQAVAAAWDSHEAQQRLSLRASRFNGALARLNRKALGWPAVESGRITPSGAAIRATIRIMVCAVDSNRA